MIDGISPNPQLVPTGPPPEAVEPQTETGQLKAKDESSQPLAAAQDQPQPGQASLPGTAESYLYRYQLDLTLSFSFSKGAKAESTDFAEPFHPPPMPTFDLPKQVSRSSVEPGSRRAVLLGALSEKRSFQARIFRQQSVQFAQQFAPATADKVRQASAGLARSYTVNFSLDVSFLQQFSRQSGTAAQLSESTLEQYTDITATLNADAPETAKAFFDQVDDLINNARDQLKSELPAFLDNMQGIAAQEKEAVAELFTERIDQFFDEASSFLDQARQRFDTFALAAAPQQELPPGTEAIDPDATI